MIVTTNLPLKELKNETMLEKKRIYDRILEMCTPIYVGADFILEIGSHIRFKRRLFEKYLDLSSMV